MRISVFDSQCGLHVFNKGRLMINSVFVFFISFFNTESAMAAQSISSVTVPEDEIVIEYVETIFTEL